MSHSKELPEIKLPILKFAREMIRQADVEAERGGLPAALAGLRKLGLEDFARLMWHLPNPGLPHLSALLPRMASAQVQNTYTGLNGMDLLRSTLAFIRQMESNYARHAGRPLQGETILDFGVGYGRMLRLLYYFTDPANIWGLDPMPEPLKLCADAGILGNLRQSEKIPVSLPTDGRRFDLAYAFSVFTHLSPASADPCLAAVRDVMNPGGLFMPTVWPREMWAFLDRTNGTTNAPRMEQMFDETGFGYLPHNGPAGLTYGNSTIAFDFFNGKGWDFLGYDVSMVDPMQVTVILRKQ